MTARVLNDVEINTILHALRVMSKTLHESGEPTECGGCDHFIEGGPLLPEQINDLCERIGQDGLILIEHPE